MIRNEEYRDGVCVAAEVIDLDAGTYTLEEFGTVTLTRALTADEIAAYTPPAPVADPAATLAALTLEAESATTVAKLRAVLVKALEALQ